MLACRYNLIAATLTLSLLCSGSQAFGFRCWNKRNCCWHRKNVCQTSCPKLQCVNSLSRSRLDEIHTKKTDKTSESNNGYTEPPQVTSTPREVTAYDTLKGKKSREVSGYQGAALQGHAYAEDRVIFDMIKHALILHWAEHGEYPQTHDEFMEKVVKYNQLQLPELDPGVEYIYDPEDRTLKIYRPSEP